MDTGNRFERDPSSGTQQTEQAFRGDTGVASSQGQGEERPGKFMRTARFLFFYFTAPSRGKLIMFS
jgi:hypothetical protein